MKLGDLTIGTELVTTRNVDLNAPGWKRLTKSTVVPKGTMMKVIRIDAGDDQCLGVHIEYKDTLQDNYQGTRGCFWFTRMHMKNMEVAS